MHVVKTKEYARHGCDIRGDLIVVDYQEDFQKDTKYGELNAEGEIKK